MQCHLRPSIPLVGLVLGFRTHSVTIYQISAKLGNAWLHFNEPTNFPGQIFLRPQSAEMCQSEWPELYHIYAGRRPIIGISGFCWISDMVLRFEIKET